MKSPPIFGAAGFGTFIMAVGTDIFPVASVAGGSKDAGPGSLERVAWDSAAGELGLRIDFSWKVSRSELGEKPPGDGRSYGERLVILLPPIDSVDEYEPEVRILKDEAAERVR